MNKYIAQTRRSELIAQLAATVPELAALDAMQFAPWTDFTIACDATSAAFTVTLPAAASNTGQIYVIKKTDSSGNAITVDPNASETIDGSTTISIGTQYAGKVIQCDGANWQIIGSF